jgi:hypothetical protein
MPAPNPRAEAPPTALEVESATPTAPAASAKVATAAPNPADNTGADLPSRDEITLAWGDHLLEGLPQRAKARWGAGHWAGVSDGAAVFALPNQHYVPRCEECKSDVEAALGAHFGRPVPVRIIVEGSGPNPASPAGSSVTTPAPDQGAGHESEDTIDLADLTDAHDATNSGLDRIAAVFPGAELVSDDDS